MAEESVTEQRQSGGLRWSLVAEILQLLSSAVLFFVLAKVLTTEDFGVLGAVTGVALPAASLAGLGSRQLLLRLIAEGQGTANSWQRATSVGLLGPAIGSVVCLLIRPYVLPSVDWQTYTFLIIGQINFFFLTELAVFLAVATRRLDRAATIRLIVVVPRFVAVGVLAVGSSRDISSWAALSAISFAVAAFGSLAYVWIVLDAAPSITRLRRSDVRLGAPYALNSTTEGFLDASDRPLLLELSSAEDAGIYTLGARIVQFGYLPLRVVMRTYDADLYEAGRRGIRAALTVTRRMAPMVLGVSAAAGACFLMFASLVPMVVGQKFADATDAIRLLAFLPPLRAVQYLIGNALGAAALQGWRVGATVVAALVNLGLNLALIPGRGWQVAVLTTFVAEALLTVLLIGITLVIARAQEVTS